MFLVFWFMRFLYKFAIFRGKGGDEVLFFHHFFCIITITNTMTNNENRDFVLIFSGKSLISNPIMGNCWELTKLTIKFHLLLAAHIPGWRARCLVLWTKGFNWPSFGDPNNSPRPSKCLYSTFRDRKRGIKAPNRFDKEILFFPEVMWKMVRFSQNRPSYNSMSEWLLSQIT